MLAVKREKKIIEGHGVIKKNGSLASFKTGRNLATFAHFTWALYQLHTYLLHRCKLMIQNESTFCGFSF